VFEVECILHATGPRKERQQFSCACCTLRCG